MSQKTIVDKFHTTRMLRSLYSEVSEFVKSSTRFTNEADFIRDATREKLERLKK